MFIFGKKERGKITAPAIGVVKPLSQVRDPVFAAGTMGMGFAIEPENGQVYAPVSGKITTLFPGGHAMGITGDDGTEVLLHIGIDTVKLKGECFTVHTTEQVHVRAGDKLVDTDIKTMRKRGIICDVICVVTSKEKCRVDEALYGTRVENILTPVMSYKK